MNRVPKNALEAGRRDREIRLLIGCERCGRRIAKIQEEKNGKLTTQSEKGVAIIPSKDTDREASMAVCERCHGQWLVDRLIDSEEPT